MQVFASLPLNLLILYFTLQPNVVYFCGFMLTLTLLKV